MAHLTDAMPAAGTWLQIGDGGGGGEVWTTIAEVKNLGGPALSLDTIDATNHGSTEYWKEFIPGALDAGEVTFDLSFIPTNATQSFIAGLILDMKNRTLRNFKLVFSDEPGLTGTVWAFPAYVTKFPPAAAVADSLNASCSLRISGKPTLA